MHRMSAVPTSDESILEEYQFRCRSLKSDNARMLLVRQNLLVLNDKNESMSKSLLNIKSECELYRNQLYKTLFNQKVAADKQKILSRKKLEEFLQSKRRTKEYYKMSPIWFELETIMKKNTSLEEACKRQAFLLDLIKQQYKELLSLLMQRFQKKVCEFSQIIMKHNPVEKDLSRKQ